MINEKYFQVCIKGIDMEVYDYANSLSVGYIERDLNKDVYGIDIISFSDNDIILDLGANNGIFSTYLALKYPKVKIIALEARHDNYQHLVETLKKNNLSNVTPLFLAVGGNERTITICGGTENSGGGSIYHNWHGWNPSNTEISNNCQTITLNKLFEKFNISKCKLIKCDIEGSEYEVFDKTNVLDKVEYLSIEFHPAPREYGHFSIEDLINHIKNSLKEPHQLIRAYS